jgi:hypothetical protein
MKAHISFPVFAQENFDSGSLMLSSVIHKFSEAGSYFGIVSQGDNIVGRFSMEISDVPTSHSVSSPTDKKEDVAAKVSFIQNSQVNIDLKGLDVPIARHVENETNKRYALAKGGYAVFHVSSGSAGYSVAVRRVMEDAKSIMEFDSRTLQSGDLFSVIVLRPGVYSVKNAKNKSEAELTVSYPEIGKIPREPQAVSIECGEGIVPNKIINKPTQGLLFHIRVPSRVKIELSKPDDRPRIYKLKPKPVLEAKPGPPRPSERKVIRRITYP